MRMYKREVKRIMWFGSDPKKLIEYMEDNEDLNRSLDIKFIGKILSIAIHRINRDPNDDFYVYLYKKFINKIPAANQLDYRNSMLTILLDPKVYHGELISFFEDPYNTIPVSHIVATYTKIIHWKRF